MKNKVNICYYSLNDWIIIMEELKILLVEDDEFAAELIYNYFLDYGFSVTFVFNAYDSLQKIENENFDVVVLDINLPDISGFEVLKKIRAKVKNIPVIITSAYRDKNIKLRAFKCGANDYMTKPIDLEELEARIWVHLRQDYTETLQTQTYQKNIFELKDSVIYFKGEKLDLTSIELDILKFFMKHRASIIKRDELSIILSTVSSERSLDNHIKNIRKKIGESAKEAQYLKTVYGVGYFFDF
jgi:DNA-binding response OmpR family regulator